MTGVSPPKRSRTMPPKVAVVTPMATRDGGAGARLRGLLGARHGNQREADRIEPEEMAVAGLRDVRREEHGERDERAGDEISRLADQEARQSEQQVPQRPAADARRRAEHDEADHVHALARRDKRAR